jgi:class 3 adenylate cyclase
MKKMGTPPPADRRLVAIVAADLVGYSRLVRSDEEGTIARLSGLLSELVAPIFLTNRGRIVKEIGDGIIAEFPSVFDAVQASIALQNAVAARNAGVDDERQLAFRIGVHAGDVLVQPNGDILGDTVNIAARLEGLAEPGGICLSEDAYRQARNAIRVKYVDLGKQNLKNITDSMRVFAIKMGAKHRTRENSGRQGGPAEIQAEHNVGTNEELKLIPPIAVRMPAFRTKLETLAKAVDFIDRRVPGELLKLPRWSFARALLVEALKTRKSRDIRTAARQLTQALQNDRWLDSEESHKEELQA